MRADLFQAVLLVGAGHNRWYVMGVAASLLNSAHDANDVAALTRVLKEHPSEKEYIQGYVTRSKLRARTAGLGSPEASCSSKSRSAVDS